jgi:Zn-dependent protease with chaperone function
MKTKHYLFSAIALLFIFSCTKVPITGRRQMKLLPEAKLITMANTEYNKFLAANTVLPGSDSSVILVKKVGSKIQTEITKYLTLQKQTKRISGFKWEFNVVKSNTVNAWCMPGGKVVVYTGLLPITQTEAGLAVVMGHEIAHAIAQHGNERMSQQLAIQMGGTALAVAMETQPGQTANIFNQVYGVSSTLGALAYSRKHESEADKLGLCFMAMAGYDPNAAVAFWERMSKNGASAPQFLSTHPSDASRIKDIKEYMPKAMKFYKKSS